MKNITESFDDIKSIQDLCDYQQVDEGLKDWFNSAKNLFGKVWNYLKGVVAKFGTYFLPVDTEGNVIPAITPMTAGQAYKNGLTGKDSFVSLERDAANIVGLKNKAKDYIKEKKGSSLAYWAKLSAGKPLKESISIDEASLANSDKQAKYTSIDTPALKKIIRIKLKTKSSPLLIWGAPGIGKTAIVEAVLSEFEEFKGYNFIAKTLSNETRESFFLPDYAEVNDERKAIDIPKTWLPVYKPTGDKERDKVADEALGKGLLFIDELSRATQGVLNVMLPLINERKLGEYRLGSGWVIIAASNRIEDDPTSDQAMLGSAMLNRFTQVTYAPHVNSWKQWAEKQGFISPLLLQWLSLPESETMSGGNFFYWDPNTEEYDEDGSRLMCTPRAWTNAMKNLCEFSETGSLEGFTIFDIDRDVLAFALNTAIPSKAVDAFMSFLDVARKIGNGGAIDAAIESIWRDGGKGLKIDKASLGLVSFAFAQLIVTSHNESLPTTKEFTNLCKWLVSQGSESLTSATLDVFKNVYCHMLSATPGRDGISQQEIVFLINSLTHDDPQAESNRKVINSMSAVQDFFRVWGVDVDTMSAEYDWEPGLNLLGDAYGEAFAARTFGGRSALD